MNPTIVNRFKEIKELYKDEYFVSIEYLDSMDAQYLLNNMHTNRTVKKPNLRRIETSLENKSWTYPSFLTISTDGELLDGQHRMLCLAKQNCKVPFVVAWNALSEAMYHLDTGVSRSQKDVFKILGYERSDFIYTVLNGVILGNLLNYFKKDRGKGMLNKKDFNFNVGTGTCDVPIQFIESFYRKHMEVFDGVIDCFKVQKTKNRKRSFPTFLLGVFIRAVKGEYCSLEQVNEFLELYFNYEEIGYSETSNQAVLLHKKLTQMVDRNALEAKKYKYKVLEKCFLYYLEENKMYEAYLNPSNIQKNELFPVSAFDFKPE